MHDGCERFFRPGYNAQLVASWLPALDGVVERLERGARVADVGCGHGASTILMAQAFPRSTFAGSDYHAGSIATARRRRGRGRRRGARALRGRARRRLPRRGYDLVTMFDCLHDMGDPVGAARHVLQTLAPDGTWMIVEPAAGDRVEDNLKPVGRAYYGFSTLLCTPASLSQDVGRRSARRPGRRGSRRSSPQAGFSRFRAGRRHAVQPRLRGAAVTRRPRAPQHPAMIRPSRTSEVRRRSPTSTLSSPASSPALDVAAVDRLPTQPVLTFEDAQASSSRRNASPSTAMTSCDAASGRQTDAAVAIVSFSAVKDSMTTGPL